MKPNTLVTLLFAGTALVGGCATADAPYGRYDNGDPPYSETRSNEGYYGVVDSIESTRGRSGDNAIAGTIIGGVIGGVIGHQIGGGTGNTVPPSRERSAAPRSGTRSARAMPARTPTASASGSTTGITRR